MEELKIIQRELKAPKNQTNNFASNKYKYRSCEDILEAVKPLLSANELTMTISDDMINLGNRFYVKATVTLSNGKESVVVTALAREAELKKGMDESQITGAASSYARKYALNGLFLIDDTKDADTMDNRQPSVNAVRDEPQSSAQKEEINKIKEALKKLPNNEGQQGVSRIESDCANWDYAEAAKWIGRFKGKYKV